MPKGKWLVYSAEELAFIQSVSMWPRAQAHAAFCQKFGRDDVLLGSFNGLCKRKGWMTGRTGSFSPGAEPHNKGKPCEEGRGGKHPNARHSQFKKGNKPANHTFIGHERIGKDGYIEMCVPVRNPYTGHSRRYMQQHRYLWEQMNGPLPKGMALKALDGNRLNTDPDNWEPIPRALLARLNGGRAKQYIAYDQAPDALKPALLLVAKVDHAARRARQVVKDSLTTEPLSDAPGAAA